MRKIFYFLLLLPLVSLQAASPGKGEVLFQEALSSGGSFDAAAGEYARLIHEGGGDRAALYYNLGNCLYLEKDFTGALSAYGEALRFRPGHGDYLENRNIVLRELDLPLPEDRGVEAILYAPLLLMGSTGSHLLLLIILLTACLSAFLALLTAVQPLRTVSLILLSAALILFLSLFAWNQRASSDAIVENADTVLRLGDSPLYASADTLPRGSTVRILEKREGWFRVRRAGSGDSQSLEGWVDGKDLLFITDLIDRLR